MHHPAVQKCLTRFVQQRAVGGDNDLEALFSRNVQQPPQRRMQQRLPHQMKIQKVRVSSQLFAEDSELCHAHKAFFASCSGAEAAVQIANIGYFQVDFFQHSLSV